MGNPNSLQYSGTGMNGFAGQALTAGQEWPRRDLSGFTRKVNYDQRSASEELNFARLSSVDSNRTHTSAARRAWAIGANGPTPQPAAAEEPVGLPIWITPHGFPAAARAARTAATMPEATEASPT